MNTPSDRLAELKNLCPDATADDLLDLCERPTVLDAQKHWVGTLAARLEVRDEELATIRTQNRREFAELKVRLDAEQREKDAELAAEKHRFKVVREGLDC